MRKYVYFPITYTSIGPFDIHKNSRTGVTAVLLLRPKVSRLNFPTTHPVPNGADFIFDSDSLVISRTRSFLDKWKISLVPRWPLYHIASILTLLGLPLRTLRVDSLWIRTRWTSTQRFKKTLIPHSHNFLGIFDSSSKSVRLWVEVRFLFSPGKTISLILPIAIIEVNYFKADSSKTLPISSRHSSCQDLHAVWEKLFAFRHVSRSSWVNDPFPSLSLYRYNVHVINRCSNILSRCQAALGEWFAYCHLRSLCILWINLGFRDWSGACTKAEVLWLIMLADLGWVAIFFQ